MRASRVQHDPALPAILEKPPASHIYFQGNEIDLLETRDLWESNMFSKRRGNFFSNGFLLEENRRKILSLRSSRFLPRNVLKIYFIILMFFQETKLLGMKHHSLFPSLSPVTCSFVFHFGRPLKPQLFFFYYVWVLTCLPDSKLALLLPFVLWPWPRMEGTLKLVRRSSPLCSWYPPVLSTWTE